MQNEFQYKLAIKLDRKADRTYVELEISAASVYCNVKEFNWPNYIQACRQSLHRVAARESLDVLAWSVDPDEEREVVSHYVNVRGVLYGTLPLRIARALRPPPGYWHLDFLERGLRRGWRVEPILKAEVDLQQLQRYDRNGERLQEPIPEQLLARALTETKWRLLISPSDSPWAYINTATQRIYARQYQATDESEGDGNEYDQKLSFEQIAAGDELQIEDVPGLLRAAGLTEDVIAVLRARAAGLKWRELPEYLTNQTGVPFDRRRVEASRGEFRRLKSPLRAAGLAASQWKPPSTDATVYRERVPDGAPWGGRWTYAHRYHGKELEIFREVMSQERIKLFRQE